MKKHRKTLLVAALALLFGITFGVIGSAPDAPAPPPDEVRLTSDGAEITYKGGTFRGPDVTTWWEILPNGEVEEVPYNSFPWSRHKELHKLYDQARAQRKYGDDLPRRQDVDWESRLNNGDGTWTHNWGDRRGYVRTEIIQGSRPPR